MSVLRKLLLGVTALVAVVLGGVVTGLEVAPAAAGPAHVCVASPQPAFDTAGAGGRGPPAVAYEYTAPPSAGDHGSRSASARPRHATTRTYTAYDNVVRFVHGETARAMTEAASRARMADVRAVSGVRSAAKSGDTLPSAGGGSARLPMSMGSVRSVASKYDVPIDDLSIGINRSIAGIRGSTASNGCVTLCRGAFESEEQLAKTLLHERVHVEDLRAGMPYPSTYDAASAAEISDEAIANAWWESFR